MIIIDGSNFIYRAFHAIPDTISHTGYHTNVVTGLTKMLDSIINEYSPTHMVFTIDPRSGSTARKKLFPDYKATRSAMPPELVEQLPYIRKLVKAYGITIISKKGIEADDIIGTLCKKFKRKTLIFTSDKDMVQLISDRVTIVDGMKKIILDQKNVKEKYGISPKQFREYLALIGDTSDNIPGVTGVGPKKALQLLNEYRAIENIYANLSSLTPSLRDNLKSGRKKFDLSLKLVTIDQDIDLKVNIQDLLKKPKNHKKVNCITQELGIGHKVGPITSL